MPKVNGLPVLCLSLVWTLHPGTPAPGSAAPRRPDPGPARVVIAAAGRNPRPVARAERPAPPPEARPDPFSAGLRF